MAPSPSRTLFFSYSWIEVFLLHLSVITGHIKNGRCNVVISSSLSVAHPIMSSCSGCWSLQFAGALAPKYRHTPWVNMDTFGGPKHKAAHKRLQILMIRACREILCFSRNFCCLEATEICKIDAVIGRCLEAGLKARRYREGKSI